MVCFFTYFIGQAYISLFPHTFGYSAVLSVIFRIFGANVLTAQLFNIVCGCGIAIMLYLIDRKLVNGKAGLFAALFWALWPSQIFYSTLVSTEAVFTLLLLVSIHIFISLKEKALFIKLFALVFFCAFANNIRPFGTILILAFSIFIILSEIHTRISLKSLLRKTVLPIGTILISYILIYNLINIGISEIIKKEVAGSPIGFTLFVGSDLKYDGTWNTEDAGVLSQMIDKGPFAAQDVHDKLENMAIKRYQAQGYNNLKLFMGKFDIMWASDDDILDYMKAGLDVNAPSSSSFTGMMRYFRIICNSYYFVMILFCAIFAFSLTRDGFNPKLAVPVLIVLGIAAVHLLVEVHGRYHYPAMAILSLLAAGGAFKIMEFIQNRKNGNVGMCSKSLTNI